MAPTPQKQFHDEGPKTRPAPGEEVVISGLSGIFPMSDSVQEFSKNLYNKVNMVTEADTRWIFEHPEVPKHLGKVTGVGKFDAQFFRVHHKQAATMEPMSMKLLEHAYSAIYDSGINPLQLRGKKIGVFIGSTHSESEKTVIYENVQHNGFGITGCNRSMYANRISYWIDGKGPSYCLDQACASSMACIEHAYRAISSGQCEAAIVGGSNLCLQPNVCLNFSRAGFLTLDGKTKCFDKSGDGYVRSDSISVLFLQKAKDAKRIYSEVYHAKSNYSPSSKQLHHVREPDELAKFFNAFYSEIGVSPSDVEYIEAGGAGFVEADASELTAIGKVFGKKNPIKIGCVKSNMGSSEAASGVCGATKVCLAFHHGKLPGNLHYNDPLDIPVVKDGTIQVLTDTTKFNRGFAALNSISYGGTNVHVLLKGHYKEKDETRYKSSIPYLVLLSGRKDDCILPLMDNMKQRPIDPEEIALLLNIHQYDIPGHMSRGFTILGKDADNKTTSLAQSVEYCSGTIPPVWFVYSGMGSQWATMGLELMRIPVFAAAIQKCHNVLEPKGIDIVRILTEPDKKIYDNILNSFVGIAAVQIGLTDILTSMGIVPDNIIGHSVGELGCAYADGCFTAEEMILSAYSRGLVSVQTPFIRGSMAAVGLGYKAVLPLCPPGIEVACHNSSESATISGPSDIMKEFVADLTSQGIFAKEVPCSNIAYHSKYIADAGPALLEYLSEVIREPKKRSRKWVSTSVPEDKWKEPRAQYSSAEYHTNNLLNPVLFEESSKFIPSDALVIEVAPHGLLQAIMKRSMSQCLHIPLTRRGYSDPVKFLLEAVGKLYIAGLNPKVDVLYPKIEYPVSTGTPFLSQQVIWEHSETWAQGTYSNKNRKNTLIRQFVMSLHDDDFSSYKGHVREGNYVFPEAALLQLVWENLAMYQGVNYRDLSVTFKEVHFLQEAIIKYDEPFRLEVMINKGNHKFEVVYEDSALVTGFINELNEKDDLHEEKVPIDNDQVILTANDIYTLMRLKGYSYEGEFQSIHSSNSMKTKASIKWNENWTTFLDSIIQFNAFAKNDDKLLVPFLINELTIDVKKHSKVKTSVGEDFTCISAYLDDIQEHTKCGGVKVEGLFFKDSSLISNTQNVLLNQQFIPHSIAGLVELKTALQVNLQLVAENAINNDIKVLLSNEAVAFKHLINECSGEITSANISIKTHNISDNLSIEEADLIILQNLLQDDKKMSDIHKTISGGTFILTIERDTFYINKKYKLFNVITAMAVNKHILILLKKDQAVDDKISFLPIVLDKQFTWIKKVQSELATSRSIVLISERQPYCGLLRMVKKLRKEHGNKIRLIIVEDYQIPEFSIDNKIFKDQIQKQLAINVYKKGCWGGYYYVSDNGRNVTTKNMRLISTKPSDIESLTWLEESVKPNSNMQVQVHYAGPSFKDAKNATLKINSIDAYGMDFSGISKSGERVMGIIQKGALATTVEADPDLLWPVPDHWTLEDAATVPLPYILAYYCLNHKVFAVTSTDVFIHGGAGALGQAFISVCHSLGLTVHASVSDSGKKQLLLNLFPYLQGEATVHSFLRGWREDHEKNTLFLENEAEEQEMQKNIVLSTDKYFTDTVKYNAKSGCGIVINNASGDKRQAVESLVSLEGLLIDFNDYDMLQDEKFGMHFLLKARHYKALTLQSIFKPELAMEKKKLQLQLIDGIAKGVVRPLSRVVYSPANVCRAFRLLSSSKHRGKVLIKMNNLEDGDLKVASSISFSPSGAYVVVCDDKIVLGMELADNLIKHGATKLVLSLKPNQLAGYCYSKLVSWKKLNVAVRLSTDNLQTERGSVNLLQEATKLGPILGIFIVQNFTGPGSLQSEDVAAKFNNTAGVVANLDSTSRKICNQLKYFAVVSHLESEDVTDEYNVSAIDTICDARKAICLPALSFHVGAVKELNEGNPEKNKSALKTVFYHLETSLMLNHSVAISVNLQKSDALFLERLSKIIGVEDISNVDENWSIDKLLMYDVSLAEIRALIYDTYKINYTIEKIKELNIISLKNLNDAETQKNSKPKDGLYAFFSKIDADECIAAEPSWSMPTAYSCVKDEEDLSPEATYLMLMPGFEGHHEVFSILCERLKLQAVAMQYGPEHTSATVPESAALILKSVKKRFQLKTKFYLLGYSYGVNVALELAKLIEKEGHVGVVFCLEGSPSATRASLDAYVGALPDTELQNQLTAHMYTLMQGPRVDSLATALRTIDSWDQKIELFVNKLRSINKFSNQYKRCILQGAYNKIMLAKQYEPDFKLQSELVLIKGSQHPDTVDLGDDYGLSKYTTKPVRIFQLEADLPSILYDCRVTSIVNRLLDPKLQEAFRNKNLCWSYVVNPDKTF